MRAAARFRAAALEQGIVPHRVEVDLKGSLSATGRGHGTPQAVLAGLHGWDPETCDVDAVHALPTRLAADPTVPWGAGTTEVRPEAVRLLPFSRDEELPHPNTMVLRALARDGRVLLEETWCSVGGGFVCRADRVHTPLAHAGLAPPKHPFHDGT